MQALVNGRNKNGFRIFINFKYFLILALLLLQNWSYAQSFTTSQVSGISLVNDGPFDIGDIDGDCDLDIVSSFRSCYSCPYLPQLYLNDGNGIFTASDKFPTSPTENFFYYFEDIDGDGDQDLLERDSDFTSITFYINDGYGRFSIGQSISGFDLSSGSRQNYFVDVDNDSDVDLFIIGEDNSDNDVSILFLNDGLGTFTPMSGNRFPGEALSNLAHADIDGDGDFDFIVSNGLGGNYEVKLYKNDGVGNFSAVVDSDFMEVINGPLAFADVDGDSDQDVLVSGWLEGSGPQSTIYTRVQLYLNDGQGSFVEDIINSFPGIGYGDFTFNDLDQDGDPDLVFNGAQDLATLWIGGPLTTYYINDGNGRFTEDPSDPFEDLIGVHEAFDADGDGDDDLFASGWGLNDLSTNLYLNELFTAQFTDYAFSIDQTPATCAGNDGSIEFIVPQGWTDRVYSLDGDTFLPELNISGLEAGEYTAYARSSEGCTHTLDFTLNQDCDDKDNDGMSDDWEIANDLDPCDPIDAFCDNDGDQVINLYEYHLGTDPDSDVSPRVIQAPKDVTSQQMNDWVRASDDDPVVIRLSEGDYTGLSLALRYNSSSVSTFKFLVQGGWDDQFCDYDPFLYRTIVRGDGAIRFFANIFEVGAVPIDDGTDALLFDGIEFVDMSIEIHRKHDELNFGVSNCSFQSIQQTGNPLSLSSNEVDSVKHILHLNNSSVVNSRDVSFKSSEPGTVIASRIKNCTFSNLASNSSYGNTGIFTGVGRQGSINLDVENSIIWSSSGMSSIYNENYDLGPQPSFLNVNLDNCYLSNLDLLDSGGVAFPSITEENNVVYGDPLFDNENPPHYTLAQNSPAKMNGNINGIFSSQERPDIGVNQFAYSSIRLVEGVTTNSPTCNQSDGSISLTIVATNKDLEYSIDNFVNSIESQPMIPNLPAGDHIVYIRTLDNCAHFQKKVTLTQDCLEVNEDKDDDGMSNGWEIANGLDECDPTDALKDNDCDAVLNLFEYLLGTNPNDAASPVKIPYRPSDGMTVFNQLMARSQNEVVIMQLHEGEYEIDFRHFPVVGWQNDADKRVMIQGGWNQDYTEYNPSCFRTQIKYRRQFLDLYFNRADYLAVILDGLEVSQFDVNTTDQTFAFKGLNNGGAVKYGVNNCSFRNNKEAFHFNMDLNAGPLDFYLINSTVADNTENFDLSIPNGTVPMNYNFINSVVTKASSTQKALLEITKYDTDSTNVNIKNCIFWDANHPNSTSIYPDKNVYLNVENSIFRGANAANEYTEYISNNIFDEDPRLVLEDGHYVLPPGSTFESAGIETGINYDPRNSAPNIGVNRNLIRLDSIMTMEPDCGQDNGSIEVFACYPGPLQFILSDTIVQTTPRFDNLPSGLYELEVKTRCGSESYSFEIDFGLGTSGSVVNKTDSSCGEENGIIELSVPDGWDSYTYSIGSEPPQSEPIFENLGPNIYIITIMPPGGCPRAIPIVLNRKDEIEIIELSEMPSTCGKNNGQKEIRIDDAQGPFTLQLDGGMSTSTNVFIGLAGGEHLIVATDSLGCIDSLEFTIPESQGIAFIDTIIVQPTCGIDNGEISLQTNDPGSITEITLNDDAGSLLINSMLASGTYEFIVTDSDGCTDSVELELEPSEPISIMSIDSTETSCNLENGAVSWEVEGNPSEFSIDGINYFEVDSFVDLSSGVYDLFAQNENCADTLAFSIAESTKPELEIAAYNDTSCGEMNGSVSLNTIGGTGPYTYTLDTITNQSGVFDTLPADSYIVYVEDFSDCVDDESVDILSSEAVQLTAIKKDGECGELGSISLLAMGTTGESEFSEDDLTYSMNSELTGLVEGDYIFYLRDSLGCFDTVSVSIMVYDIPELTAEVTPAYCEEPVGTATLAGTGGRGVLQFAKLGEQESLDNIFEDLSTGSITFIVTDESGCTSEKEIEIPSTPAVRIENLAAEQLFCGDELSALEFTPAGGTGTKTSELTDSEGNLVDETASLPEGQYRLTVKDEVGCEITELVVVQKEDCQMYIPTIFDPLSEGEDRAFRIGVPDASDFFIASFQILDRWGNLVYSEKNIDPLTFTDWWDGTFNGREVEQGVYLYQILLDEDTDLIRGSITLIR